MKSDLPNGLKQLYERCKSIPHPEEAAFLDSLLDQWRVASISQLTPARDERTILSSADTAQSRYSEGEPRPKNVTIQTDAKNALLPAAAVREIQLHEDALVNAPVCTINVTPVGRDSVAICDNEYAINEGKPAVRSNRRSR